GASFTQRTVSSISIGGSINLEGFLSSILLSVFLSTDVFLGSELGLLSLAIDAACVFRAEEMPSLISCWMAAKVMAGVSDVDVLLGGILST
ncbi:hypothetical protein Tco_1076339, partial [Tanacetum coccineum]